jgi:divalent metal cation (Fe/Co/Zn/Cd) transporter
MSESTRTARRGFTGEAEKQRLRDGFTKLRKLEWLTIFYQIVAAAIVLFLAGNSQSMKTEWFENALAIVPPLGVLLTYHTENKNQDVKRPFGYHRASTVAFVAAAFALAGIGTFLFYDAAHNLLTGEHPSIGGFTLFGRTIWHGWLMVFILITTAIPPVLLARAKIPVAKLLHDKALFADADMNRANWLSNGAGVIGLLLVASGQWWGDSLAALLISLDIMRDGWGNVAKSLSDVMDHQPTELESGKQDPIVANMHRALRALPFVEDVRVLVREHGRYFFAEIFVKPKKEAPEIVEATQKIRDAVLPLDWRLQHLAIEITDDMENAANVLTREELEIESKGSG